MNRKLLLACLALLTGLTANAQSFEIRTSHVSGNTFAVQMRETSGGANLPVASDDIFDISFGVYWPNAYGVNLGSVTTSYSITKSGSETVNGAEEYQLFTLSAATTVPSSWTQNVWVTIMSIPVTGGTGTGTFTLIDAGRYGGGLEPYAEIDVTSGLYANNPTINGAASGVALPVTLTYFSAMPENIYNAKLSWQTATEENNRGFYVERSVNGIDWQVVNFSPTLAPGGNSDVLVNYEYTDLNAYKPESGVSMIYYRLRQQDINGEEEFVGGIQAVRFNEMGAADLVSTYPNPASSKVNITVKSGAPISYQLIDMSGRTVMRGSYTPSVDVSALQSGTYQLIVTDITGSILGTQNISIAR